jgi:hypothetical protein
MKFEPEAWYLSGVGQDNFSLECISHLQVFRWFADANGKDITQNADNRGDKKETQ